jgi:hypothetical protein
MQLAIRILANTPIWVFALLAYLIWQGSQAIRPRTRPIWRMLIVPLVFLLIGLSRLLTARRRGRAAVRLARGGAVVCMAGAFPPASAARRRPKEPDGDPAGQYRPVAPQHHGIRAAIRGRGRDRHEAGTPCRGGDRRTRRLRRQCGLLLRLDRGAIAPLRNFDAVKNSN